MDALFADAARLPDAPAATELTPLWDRCALVPAASRASAGLEPLRAAAQRMATLAPLTMLRPHRLPIFAALVALAYAEAGAAPRDGVLLDAVVSLGDAVKAELRRPPPGVLASAIGAVSGEPIHLLADRRVAVSLT